MIGAFEGRPKEELLAPRLPAVEELFEDEPLDPRVDEIAGGGLPGEGSAGDRGDGLRGRHPGGSPVGARPDDDLRRGRPGLVNLANDADTTGAVYGQVAGAFYGPGQVEGTIRAQGGDPGNARATKCGQHDRERRADLMPADQMFVLPL